MDRKNSNIKCVCEDVDEIIGPEIQDYCSKHLQKVSVDGEKWEITYICPITNIQWIKDYPHSEYHGGGPPRLQKLPLVEETNE